jgi:hypothetical protein
MSIAEWTKTGAARLALAACGTACVVLIWTLVRALHPAPLPAAPAPAAASVATIGRGAVPPPANIQAAIENDLFASDRSAPSSPYRMPGDKASDGEPVAEPMKPNVLGTAVATDGRNFATLQLGDASPTLVHVGDRIGEWVVKGIARGKVVLVSGGGSRAELTVSKPGT